MTNVAKELSMRKGDTSGLHAGYVSVAEITINAPASTVWPQVLILGSWIYDFHFEHISGARIGEGEIMYLWPDGAEGVLTIADSRRWQ